MSWQIPCLLAVLLGAAEKADQAGKYPRAHLLIEAAELARPAVRKKYVILDTRSEKEWKAGHIPQAEPVDVKLWDRRFAALAASLGAVENESEIKNLNTSKEVLACEILLGGHGIGPNTPVVVYGDDLRDTARVWWIVRYWGVRDVRILNGGWKGWVAIRGKRKEIDIMRHAHPQKGLTQQHQRLTVKRQLLQALKQKSVQIADARSTKEYCGEANTAKRNGAIPTARHLDWNDLVDPKTQRFKSPAQLRRLIEGAGIDLDKPTVTYCQSGGRASVLAFALELMGARDVRNYYRSWAEWGNAKDTPVEKPKARK
jgi:thiosulfate/3-mercaptopyruvate sulfurtransferase